MQLITTDNDDIREMLFLAANIESINPFDLTYHLMILRLNTEPRGGRCCKSCGVTKLKRV